MGEERDVAIECAEAGDEAIRTGTGLIGCFPIRKSVPEEIPIRSRGKNIRKGTALVITIVPLSQVRLYLGRPCERCQRTGLLRPLQRAGQYMGERNAAEALPHATRFILALRSQCDVQLAGVLAGERPLGCTVPDEIKAQRFGLA